MNKVPFFRFQAQVVVWHPKAHRGAGLRVAGRRVALTGRARKSKMGPGLSSEWQCPRAAVSGRRSEQERGEHALCRRFPTFSVRGPPGDGRKVSHGPASGANRTRQARSAGMAASLRCSVGAGLKPSAAAGLARKSPPSLAQWQRSLPWNFDSSSPSRLPWEARPLARVRPGSGVLLSSGARAVRPRVSVCVPLRTRDPSGFGAALGLVSLADRSSGAARARLLGAPRGPATSPPKLRVSWLTPVVTPGFKENRGPAHICVLPASLTQD